VKVVTVLPDILTFPVMLARVQGAAHPAVLRVLLAVYPHQITFTGITILAQVDSSFNPNPGLNLSSIQSNFPVSF